MYLFRENNPAGYDEHTGVYVPSTKWYDDWVTRMVQLAEFADVRECLGKATDISKIKWYTTKNINTVRIIVCVPSMVM